MMLDKLNILVERIEEIQHINLKEDGVSFAKSGFTDLYNIVKDIELLDVTNLVKAEKRGLVKGLIIGGLSVGIGAYGYNKLEEIKREVEEEIVEKLRE